MKKDLYLKDSTYSFVSNGSRSILFDIPTMSHHREDLLSFSFENELTEELVAKVAVCEYTRTDMDKVNNFLTASGLRPATIRELINFRLAYPLFCKEMNNGYPTHLFATGTITHIPYRTNPRHVWTSYWYAAGLVGDNGYLRIETVRNESGLNSLGYPNQGCGKCCFLGIKVSK